MDYGLEVDQILFPVSAVTLLDAAVVPRGCLLG